MIELGMLCAETCFDVPKTVAISELCERHATELIGTGERFYLVVPAIALNTTSKRVRREMCHYLREDEIARVHKSRLLAHQKGLQGDSD